mmetsp:Transcript_82684/g.164993  ORF Transcript_82684/g.164993 Transcript_82684/m.164993 type:complete len:242 (+) Transcript_82684:1122-1847(+)
MWMLVVPAQPRSLTRLARRSAPRTQQLRQPATLRMILRVNQLRQSMPPQGSPPCRLLISLMHRAHAMVERPAHRAAPCMHQLYSRSSHLKVVVPSQPRSLTRLARRSAPRTQQLRQPATLCMILRVNQLCQSMPPQGSPPCRLLVSLMHRACALVERPLCSKVRHLRQPATVRTCQLYQSAMVLCVNQPRAAKLMRWTLISLTGAVVLILDMHAANVISDLMAARRAGNVINVGNTSMTAV